MVVAYFLPLALLTLRHNALDTRDHRNRSRLNLPMLQQHLFGSTARTTGVAIPGLMPS